MRKTPRNTFDSGLIHKNLDYCGYRMLSCLKEFVAFVGKMSENRIARSEQVLEISPHGERSRPLAVYRRGSALFLIRYNAKRSIDEKFRRVLPVGGRFVASVCFMEVNDEIFCSSRSHHWWRFGTI